MKKHLILQFFVIILLIGNSFSTEARTSINMIQESGNEFVWAEGIGGNDNEAIVASARDNAGNLYTVGSFNATVEFSPGIKLTSKGKGDLFLAKYDGEGKLLWIKQAFGPDHNGSKSLALTQEAIYICGDYIGTTDFGNGIILKGAEPGVFQSYIAKFDINSGDIIWAKNIGNGNPSVQRITTNSLGQIFIAGNLDNGAHIILENVLANYADVYVARIDSDGNLVWVQTGGGRLVEYLGDLVAGNNNDVYICGRHERAVPFNDKFTGPFKCGYFVTKYSASDGSVEWVRSGKIHEYGMAESMVVDNDGHVTIGGVFNGEINFENGDRFVGMFNGFIAQFNSKGNLRWAKQLYAQNSYTTVSKLATDTLGNIFAFGRKDGVLKLGNEISVAAQGNMYLAMYDNIGRIQWAVGASNKSDISPTSVICDGRENLYLMGAFRDTLSLGKDINLRSNGVSDIFIAKFHVDTLLTGRDSTPGVDKLTLLYPNGGEEIAAGSIIDIRWNGISSEDTVSLYYSSDNGEEWVLISNTATHLLHTWHVPNSIGNKYTVKVIPNSKNQLNFKAEWGRSIGDTLFDTMISSSIDNDDNIYILGVITGKVDLGNNVSLTSYHPQVSNYSIAKFNHKGHALWAKNLPNSIGGWRKNNYSNMSIDSEDNMYITGSYSDSTDFGDGIVLHSNGETDGCVLKYNTHGEIQWVRRIDAPGESINKVITDKSGNVYVSGTITESANFGDGITLNGASSDFFLAKYNETGAIQWAKVANSNHVNIVTGMNIDVNGDVLLCGVFKGLLNFDTTQIVTGSISDDHDLFVVKYNSSGTVKWAKAASGAGAAQSQLAMICSDIKGNIYLAGATEGMADFTNNVRLTTEGKQDMFVVKYSTEGKAQWVRSLGNRFQEEGFISIAFANDHVYACGYRDANAYIVQYDTTGMLTWKDSVVQNGETIATSIAVGKSGAFYVGGVFTRTMDFRTPVRLNSAGERDIFLVKYTNQTDISDSPWSIIKPTLDYIGEIDMGEVKISESKDSIITSCIRNLNTFAVRIDSISLIGGNSQDYATLSFSTPLMLQSMQDHEVTLRFSPTASGIRQTQLQIHLQGENKDNISVRGKGVTSDLTLFPVRPMPAVGESLVEFELPEEMYIQLLLTDLIGKKINLTEGVYKPGRHSVRLNTSIVSIGAYTVTLQTPNTMLHQKIIIK